MNGLTEWQERENQRMREHQAGEDSTSRLWRENAALRIALQNMIDIYWADGDGQLPEPKCIIDARLALASQFEGVSRGDAQGLPVGPKAGSRPVAPSLALASHHGASS